MLGIGSALYKTPLKRRFGTLGVKQANSSHIPANPLTGVQAPLDFLRSAMPHYENFDSRFAFAQDDMQTRPYTADVKNGIAVFGTFRSKREAVSFAKQLNICDLWSQLH